MSGISEEKETQSLEQLDKRKVYCYIPVDEDDPDKGGKWMTVIHPRQFAMMANRNPSQISVYVNTVDRYGNRRLNVVYPFQHGEYLGSYYIIMDQKAEAYLRKRKKLDRKKERRRK